MNLLSGLLGSKYPTPSPIKLVGIRFQDLVDILHILWFLFCQDAHCFGEERGEGKEMFRILSKVICGSIYWFCSLCINLLAWP